MRRPVARTVGVNLFKNIRLRLAVLGAALLLPVVGACGSADDDAGLAASASSTSTSAVAASATTLGEPSVTNAPTTTSTVVTTTSTTSTTSTTTTTTSSSGPIQIAVSVNDGSVEGGGRIRVELGAAVRLTVTADVADEVHLHGYDVFVDVTPGTPTILEFVADIPGIFEAELESSGLVLFDLVVEP